MELIDPIDGKTFECPQGWPSNTRRKVLSRIDEKRAAAVAELVNEYPDVFEITKLPEKERGKRTSEDPKLAVRSTEYGSKVTDIMNNAALEVCQASLDTRSLTAERRALIESDVTSEFWQEQSMPAVEEAGDRFRQSYRRGRRPHPVDPNVDGDESATATVEDAAGAGGATEAAA